MYKPKRKVRTCVDCGCECRSTWFRKPIEDTRCLSCSNKGSRHPNWKGGKKMQSGYVLIHQPDRPNSDANGYIKRSHLVWETANDRYIQSGEIIHHVDGCRDNDVSENLRLMTPSEHGSLHMAGKTGENHPNYKHGKYVGKYAKYKKNP